jgi:hypothetical protein
MGSITVDRIAGRFNALGRDVEITARPTPRSGRQGQSCAVEAACGRRKDPIKRTQSMTYGIGVRSTLPLVCGWSERRNDATWMCRRDSTRARRRPVQPFPAVSRRFVGRLLLERGLFPVWIEPAIARTCPLT